MLVVRGDKVKKSFSVAFGGIMLGLTLAVLCFAGIMPTNKLTMLAIAAFVQGIVVKECGLKISSAVYVAVCLLGWLIVPVKTIWIMYLLFFGLYPIIRESAHKCKNSILTYVLKMAFFNGVLFAGYWLIVIFAKIFTDGINFYILWEKYASYLPKNGNLLIAMVIIVLNVCFVLFDILYKFVMIAYEQRLSKYNAFRKI